MSEITNEKEEMGLCEMVGTAAGCTGGFFAGKAVANYAAPVTLYERVWSGVGLVKKTGRAAIITTGVVTGGIVGNKVGKKGDEYIESQKAVGSSIIPEFGKTNKETLAELRKMNATLEELKKALN